MYTLGINAAFHDPAAVLVKDGLVVAAAEEERFTRIKHGKRPIPFAAYELPFHAIDYCLSEAGILLVDVDHMAYSFDPLLLLGPHGRESFIALPLQPSAWPPSGEWDSPWDPLFLSHCLNAPRHLAGGVPHHLQKRFRGAAFDGPFTWHFVEHHDAHAASAFFPSPFDEAAVLTMDGRGERVTTAYAKGSGSRIERISAVEMPHSLGLFYEKVTSFLGFLHSADEYKVMALASFGKPRYLSEFRRVVLPGAAGMYTVGPSSLEEMLGPPRLPGEPFQQRHCDIAHSLQAVLEETVLGISRWLREATGKDNLCISGGVGLNCVLNSRIRDEGVFKKMWVQPAAGDAGTALGAALLIDRTERGDGARLYRMTDAYLGPQFGPTEIEHLLHSSLSPFRKVRDMAGEVADLLAKNKIVGWFQGRMEFGPRALGARSILASPLDPSIQGRLNEIKDREDFRPVAPVVIEEDAPQWFEIEGESPFMLFVHRVLPEKRDLVPGVVHVDGTARLQTVKRGDNALYYDLITAFKKLTGVPVLVNTSFNTRGRPIVCTPKDALECFWTSPLNALAIGPYLVEKPGDKQS